MRFLGKLAIGLGVIGAAGAGVFAWASRDLPATHPALAGAALPPLIPVRDFYADRAAQWNFAASEDGSYVAWRETAGTREVVSFGRPGEAPMGSIPDVQGFDWDRDSNYLMMAIDGRLWKVDPLAPEKANRTDVTPRGFGMWQINPQAGDGTRQLVLSGDRGPAAVDLYTTDRDGGDKRLLLRNDDRTVDWFLSEDLDPLLRIRRAEDDADLSIEVRDAEAGSGAGDDGWREVLTVPSDTVFAVQEVSRDGTGAHALSSRGRDAVALVRVDLATGEETVIHEEADEDVLRTFDTDPHDDRVDAVLTWHGDSRIVPFSPAGEALARLVAREGERVDVNDLYFTGGGRHVTASLSPDALNYVYRLLDLEAETAIDLGEFSFRRNHGPALAMTEEVAIPARDGLTLPALLVRPKGVDGPVPMVVEVHGGPAAHVRWEYDHMRQFLANRGYAVLSVNFRGSTGFGKAFQAAGFGTFGRAMQDDLEDAAAWAVAEGIADPGAVAVSGASYGGYAAAMAVLRPDTPFAAAIVEHAMLDVAYQSQYPPAFWGLGLPEWTRYFGDPDDPDALETMRGLSPVTMAAALKTPMLLVAGKRDGVVGFEQTEAFLGAAGEAGGEAELLLFEDEGHGLSRWQSRVVHARRVEGFLRVHLGGRSGGWDWIEPAARILD